MSISETPKLIAVSDYLKIKLDRNKLYSEFLTKHNELLNKEIILSYRTSETNKKKLEMFNSVNEIEKKQFHNFSPEQEEYVKTIYTQINELMPNDHAALINDINELKQECMRLRERVNDFNLQIPNTIDIAYTSK